MARETITDLLYQYIRAVVHYGFRDGMVAGARDAMGLPPQGDEIEPDVDGKNPGRGSERAGDISHSPRTLPGLTVRQLPNLPPKDGSVGGPGEKRGRGRPRKYPPSSAPAGEKTPHEKMDEGGQAS